MFKTRVAAAHGETKLFGTVVHHHIRHEIRCIQPFWPRVSKNRAPSFGKIRFFEQVRWFMMVFTVHTESNRTLPRPRKRTARTDSQRPFRSDDPEMCKRRAAKRTEFFVWNHPIVRVVRENDDCFSRNARVFISNVLVSVLWNSAQGHTRLMHITARNTVKIMSPGSQRRERVEIEQPRRQTRDVDSRFGFIVVKKYEEKKTRSEKFAFRRCLRDTTAQNVHHARLAAAREPGGKNGDAFGSVSWK